MYEASVQENIQLAHLHILQAIVQTVLCGLLIRLLRKRPDLFASAPPENAARPDRRFAGSCGGQTLFPLFFAGAIFFLLAGFALGTAFPETIPNQHPSLYVPVILLTLAPAIGLLLDKNRHGVRLVAAFLVVCAFAISLAPLADLGSGASGFFLPLFYLGRDSLLLLFWFVILRLAGSSPFFPLLSVLVLSLNGVSHLGTWLAQVVPDAAVIWSPFALALCFTLLVAYLCRPGKGALSALSVPPVPPVPPVLPVPDGGMDME